MFSLSEDNRSIDPALGYAGRAAPWLAIILASAVCNENGPQVIAAQPAADKDDIWVGGHHQRRSSQGNAQKCLR